MEKITFKELAKLVLEQEKRPLTPFEIWEISKEKNYNDLVGTQGKTPAKSIEAQLYVDIKKNPKTVFFKYGKAPVKFFLNQFKETVPLEQSTDYEIADEDDKSRFKERDLHPLLTEFIFSDQHFKAQSKTILHESSSKGKKGYNKWLHPDMVGVYFPFEDYEPETLNLQKGLLLNSVKIFSFELKISLNLGNIRECFFQALSNSSRANEGYLVAFHISNDQEFLDEFRRLNNSFGIGLIQLNASNVYDSEILFSSKYNDALDRNTIDRLVAQNPDFKTLVEGITDDLKTNKIRAKYDLVMGDKEIRKYANDKHMLTL